MLTRVAELWRDEEAPTAVEYVIVASGIAVVMLVGALLFGKSVLALFTDASQRVPAPR